ncbi:MAG TPA: fibronectin type III domain-containing protein [Thermoanaerobaculia bacterium]|nr:fibronectin type III domain-containing protein [Thermoanaerobaculia bacterium]
MFDTSSAFTSPTYVWAGGANTTSYTHTGLNAATTYYYKIKAEGNPDSGWTAADSATTAPSNLAGTATSNSAVGLTWNANGSNANITGYTYAYANNSSFSGATYVWVAGNGTGSTSRGGLATATTYWLKLKAEGTADALDSPYGTAVAATTTPASVAATAVSSSQINISWSGNGANANITGYTVARATNSAFTGAVYQYVNGAGATSFSSTGLTAGTTYYYEVKAEGTVDGYDSPFTGAVTATTSGAAPNAPSGLSAAAISNSRIDLSWTDNSTNETAFELKRATDGAFTQNVVWIGGIQGATYSNTGLAANTTYYYKVRAKGSVQDSAYSAAASATTLPSDPTVPQPPSGLTVTAVSSTSVTLSWTDNSTNETGFEVERATDSAFTQNVVWSGGLGAPPYTNNGLTPNTTYYYKVRAEGSAGKSAYSNSVSATTSGGVTGGVPISPRFFGINAWMPSQVGGAEKNGKLDQKWPQVQQSGVRSMRYGGIAVDQADPYWIDNPSPTPSSYCVTGDSRETAMKQYAQMVDSMRAIGAEPILQVPVNAEHYTPQKAAALVQCINITLSKGVKYWSIGNEPDLMYAGYGAPEVARYMRSFATAMKAVDPSIRILGPETAWYDTAILNSLVCGADDITGAIGTNTYSYVDVISFHTYPFPDKDGNGTKYWPTRGAVITELDTFKANLVSLADRVSQCNAAKNRTGDNALKIAVTEANINYDNPSDDNLDGVGATSFLGGQFWAEMMGVAMLQGVDIFTFWSVIEGNDVTSDKGYLCRDGVTIHPSYDHFKLMATHFRGNALQTIDTQPNVKTFAAKDTDQIAVMILNEDGAATFPYDVRLDSAPVSGAATLKINVPAGLGIESAGTIGPQSTVLLLFDANGTRMQTITLQR